MFLKKNIFGALAFAGFICFSAFAHEVDQEFTVPCVTEYHIFNSIGGPIKKRRVTVMPGFKFLKEHMDVPLDIPTNKNYRIPTIVRFANGQGTGGQITIGVKGGVFSYQFNDLDQPVDDETFERKELGATCSLIL